MSSFVTPRLRCLGILVTLVWLILGAANRASAIGWGPTDFLIGGGQGFTSHIGVFDQNLTFKGYLETNFVTVAGMDFDAAGHLAAVASGNERAVRVYDSSGGIVGGFARSDNLLGDAADLKAAPDGSYIVATQNFGGGDGARQFAKTGTYVRQFGAGDITGVAVVSDHRLWIGGIGTGPIGVYDIDDGALIGSLSVPTVNSIDSMTYSRTSNTVLIATIGNRVIEAELNGNLLRTFTAPSNVRISAVTRGPNGDVFATAGDETVLHWLPNGSFVSAVSTSDVLGGAGGIVWAGNAPEPAHTAGVSLVMLAASRSRIRKRKVR